MDEWTECDDEDMVCPLCEETGEICYLDIFERCLICNANRGDNWQKYERLYTDHISECPLCVGDGYLEKENNTHGN